MAWGAAEKAQWREEQTIKRSYGDEVVRKILALASRYELVSYGALSFGTYPLYLLKSKNFDTAKSTVLITGGVHGYETSGVHGAIGFLERAADRYSSNFNFICAPCVSPWAYETINRWTPLALDTNRSFYKDSPAEESRLLLEAIAGLDVYAHFDLHETTDTDNSVFRPALEMRDGIQLEWSEIPDGFYVVGDTDRPQPEFQKAIVDAVRKVTHIAPPDANGKIIGDPVEQDGVINYPVQKVFLCAGLTKAPYVTTTEVYPDSPKATPAICIDAQIAAICGGLNYLSSV